MTTRESPISLANIQIRDTPPELQAKVDAVEQCRADARAARADARARRMGS
jgi:hypothetical protein